MIRTFSAKDLIQLPRLNGREAVVLITQVETGVNQLKEKHLWKSVPAAVQRSYARLLEARTALEAILSPQGEQGDTQAKRKADRAIDNAWSATFDWLRGWCKLPAEKNPHLERAQSLFELVFAESLEFIKLPYKIEWQESKSRLDAIARDGHETTFKALGGTPFLQNLTEMQAAYGTALHITAAKPEESAVDLAAKLTAALEALRDYVKRAAATGDPDDPASLELEEALLAPVTSWETRAAASGGEPEPAAPVDGKPAKPAAPSDNVT